MHFCIGEGHRGGDKAAPAVAETGDSASSGKLQELRGSRKVMISLFRMPPKMYLGG
jgi:hypothetical protein